jgi:hypothetical protein
MLKLLNVTKFLKAFLTSNIFIYQDTKKLEKQVCVLKNWITLLNFDLNFKN